MFQLAQTTLFFNRGILLYFFKSDYPTVFSSRRSLFFCRGKLLHFSSGEVCCFFLFFFSVGGGYCIFQSVMS